MLQHGVTVHLNDATNSFHLDAPFGGLRASLGFARQQTSGAQQALLSTPFEGVDSFRQQVSAASSYDPTSPTSIKGHGHTFRRSATGFSTQTVTEEEGSGSVVSVTEGQLQHVFEYLTHYFVLMYFVDTGGQALTLLIEVGGVALGFEQSFYCFHSVCLMLDFVFVVLLAMDVGLSLFLLGWKQYSRTNDNLMLLILLLLSVGSLLFQLIDVESNASTLVVEVVKNLLRASRVVVFYRKLQTVLESPLHHWDIHADILKEEIQPSPC